MLLGTCAGDKPTREAERWGEVVGKQARAVVFILAVSLCAGHQRSNNGGDCKLCKLILKMTTDDRTVREADCQRDSRRCETGQGDSNLLQCSLPPCWQAVQSADLFWIKQVLFKNVCVPWSDAIFSPAYSVHPPPPTRSILDCAGSSAFRHCFYRIRVFTDRPFSCKYAAQSPCRHRPTFHPLCSSLSPQNIPHTSKMKPFPGFCVHTFLAPRRRCRFWSRSTFLWTEMFWGVSAFALVDHHSGLSVKPSCFKDGVPVRSHYTKPPGAAGFDIVPNLCNFIIMWHTLALSPTKSGRFVVGFESLSLCQRSTSTLAQEGYVSSPSDL